MDLHTTLDPKVVKISITCKSIISHIFLIIKFFRKKIIWIAISWTDSSTAQNFKTAIHALRERVSIGGTTKTTQNSTHDDMMMHARLISSSPKFANIIIWQYT